MIKNHSTILTWVNHYGQPIESNRICINPFIDYCILCIFTGPNSILSFIILCFIQIIMCRNYCNIACHVGIL